MQSVPCYILIRVKTDQDWTTSLKIHIGSVLLISHQYGVKKHPTKDNFYICVHGLISCLFIFDQKLGRPPKSLHLSPLLFFFKCLEEV